ncbi:hypothetical protein THICB1_10188 [Thiomonas arsenitoxydans]|jgi:hypothetical protein|uniref:Uncharacterized protein n=1 Tax=Thiomonas arsenitoxydans (strain DSM 22701 / CIP 110005 / 3As) TaxID=426114 RepID=A0ABM9SZH6_THIA3|nr:MULTISPECIES: hypothetical protein [Thiomonas]MDE2175509.1 hypothetical protein [Betaproteobacteria bacterium]CQR44202.1 hypothetical protein THICB3490049 [Thiomonas sp. CB3]CDW95862.1 hypothetical protein THICB2_720006 [Thiomonas sp. CB2]CQR26445.1 hypothetical protein THICB1_10188 [Thiomonas arsenitoxydans]CQR27941.1 hypothetical protein THICB6_130036 [Thiomonas arsenitoxydans]
MDDHDPNFNFERLKAFSNANFDNGIRRALAGQETSFLIPVLAPVGDTLQLVSIHKLRLHGADRAEFSALYPDSGVEQSLHPAAFAAPWRYEQFHQRLGAANGILPKLEELNRAMPKVVITDSSQSALAISAKGGRNAIAAMRPENFRAVASDMRAAGFDVVIVPDNNILSRALARNAARETGALVANVPFQPGQNNLMSALIDATEQARDIDVRRLILEPISNAAPPPAIGLSHPARAIAEIGR